MLFDFKSVVLYGLIALAHASPVPELSKRAKLSDFKCPDGTELSEADIRTAFEECRAYDDGKVGKYPAYFSNMSGNKKILTNVPDNTKLREFPIKKGGKYTSGPPGAYRVVTDYKDNKGDFRGVIQHTGPTVGGAYSACTRVTKSKREAIVDEEDNEERDVQVDEDESPEESTDDTASDLEARGNKKKVGSATCDGKKLSKEDVGRAFAELKKSADKAHGGYPHKFGNKSGKTQVFAGVTKDLREYPIVEGKTWTSGPPGKYRVVADYKGNFVGVMIEKPGSVFDRCEVHKD